MKKGIKLVGGLLSALGIASTMLFMPGGGGTQIVPADELQIKEYKMIALRLGTDWEMAMIIDMFCAEANGSEDISKANYLYTQINFCEVREEIYEKWEDTDEDGNIVSSGWDLTETNLYTGSKKIYEYLGLSETEKNVGAFKQATLDKTKVQGQTKYKVEGYVLGLTIEEVVAAYYPELSEHVLEMQELYDSHYFLELYKDVGIDDAELGFETGELPDYVGDISFDESIGGQVSAWASSKVGCEYSQENRFGERSFDCSSLVYRAYKTLNINISYEGSTTAASIAKGLVDRQCVIGYNELAPGDLIFYSTSTNGRYKNITHVAMYIGEGQIVHARNKKTGVRLDAATYCQSYIKVIARPSGVI